ncbi:MAG: hypothetical protein AAFV80_06775, partial [Bacteroidota bacterium]
MQKMIFVLVGLSVLLFAAFTPSDDPDWLSKIDAPILEQFDISAVPQNVLVLMNDQADLSYAQQLRTKAEKGQWVFQQLQVTATSAQAGLLRWLDQQN